LQDLRDIHRALIARGFDEAGPWEKGLYKYNGQLHTSKGPFDVLVTLKNIHEPPRIKLVEVPDSLKPLAPHIGPLGDICYIASGSITMDIFNPASQILACIDRATEVLSQIINGELVKDLTDEFFAYWYSLSSVYIDVKNIDTTYPAMCGIDLTSLFLPSMVLTDNPERSGAKLKSFGQNINKEQFGACIIETSVNPTPLTSGVWPPENLEDFIAWQSKLDINAAKRIIRRMKTIYDQGFGGAIILISSPTVKYSTGIIFPKNLTQLKSYAQAKKALASSKVKQMNTIRIDDQYIVERNQPGRHSLLGLKIGLIGAGTIGGYLADLLVRGGAGLGEGRFDIIDYGVFEAGNIGRHRLGLESLDLNKATALVKQILVSFPSAKLNPISKDAKSCSLENFDFIINATGEQALGDWLSLELNHKKFVPLLHVWIEGPGTAVRTILQTTLENACFRCLIDNNRNPIYPTVTETYEIKMAGQGCESLYVPFPATTSAFAASLAASHIMDWVNGEGAPLLRTMVIDKKYHQQSHDQNPVKQSNCPACHITVNG
jgi:molybdopterin/thiamine biosynthesis adenylyltransferase